MKSKEKKKKIELLNNEIIYIYIYMHSIKKIIQKNKLNQNLQSKSWDLDNWIESK